MIRRKSSENPPELGSTRGGPEIFATCFAAKAPVVSWNRFRQTSARSMVQRCIAKWEIWKNAGIPVSGDSEGGRLSTIAALLGASERLGKSRPGFEASFLILGWQSD